MDINQQQQSIEELLCSVPTLEFTFRQLSEKNIFPDCTIICTDGVKIQAHKRYLCAYSTYFQSELGSEIKAHGEVHMDATSHIVLKLLDFVYTSTVDWGQSIDDTKELLRCSQIYNLAALKNRMTPVLSRRFSVYNIIELCNFAQLHDLQPVLRVGAKFIGDNIIEMEEKFPDWKNQVDSAFANKAEGWVGFKRCYGKRARYLPSAEDTET